MIFDKTVKTNISHSRETAGVFLYSYPGAQICEYMCRMCVTQAQSTVYIMLVLFVCISTLDLVWCRVPQEPRLFQVSFSRWTRLSAALPLTSPFLYVLLLSLGLLGSELNEACWLLQNISPHRLPVLKHSSCNAAPLGERQTVLLADMASC